MPYQAKYVRISKIKELLIEEGTKIRISGEAKEKVAEYLDTKVAEAVKALIDKLPRKSKGEKKGDLKRITILPEDFQTPPPAAP
jgi:hypothetical protein